MKIESYDYNIDLTRPCVDDPNKYIAQSSFRRTLSMIVLCQILQENLISGLIAQLSCSKKLGVARFDFKDKTIIIYESGKIDIRRSYGVEDARDTMKEVQSMIVNSFNDISFD